ncbi:hypothetical protein ELE95_30635, partial [Klebsiella pneumoniae]|nr:hypothetical protein [Klebsiella pneumoniae]
INSKMPRPTMETYEIIMETLNQSRKTSKVIEVYKEISSKHEIISEKVHLMIIDCYSKQGRIEEALKIFEESDYKLQILPKFLHY